MRRTEIGPSISLSLSDDLIDSDW